MDYDGKILGFTPVESVIVQLELLRQMWQNQLAVHKNGGGPDKAIVLKNEGPDSLSFERIADQLERYKIAENKHGNWLLTGDIDIIDWNNLNEMEFKDLGLYITGIIAMLWGIPRSAIPFIVGGTNTKSDVGGDSEKAY